VVVRHIQTFKLEDAQKVKELADKGIDFTLLVTRYSTHESRKNGGLLPPIGQDTVQVSPAIRNVALAMKRIGEISNPIQAGTRWYILKLEKVIEPKGVKYADVKDKIAASLRERRISMYQNEILQKLIAEAKIQYVHPILKEQEAKAKAAAKKPE
jgi:parvulin-like peptidyl-prolyl isomerase